MALPLFRKGRSDASDFAARKLENIVKNGRLTLESGDGAPVTLGKEHPLYPSVTITVPKRVHMLKMLLLPDPYFLEGYVRGWWDARNGELEDVLLLLARNLRRMPAPFWRSIMEGALHLRFLMRQRANSKLGCRFVSHHYDIGDDLYHKFLDPAHLLYSCAFFDAGAVDLPAAQERKLRITLQRLNVPDGGRVLDIGCGWGGVTRYIARNVPNAHTVGITLSRNQYEYAEQARLGLPGEQAARLEYALHDYREHEPGLLYDRIVSIGMFEHVGLFRHRAYFAAVERLLRPGGRAVIHTIVRPQRGRCSTWIDRNIFPGGYIPSIADVQRALEAEDLLVENIHCHAGENYQKTLRAWRKNYRGTREQLPADKYDERFHRMWEMYFASSIYTFDAGLDAYQVAQFVLRKR